MRYATIQRMASGPARRAARKGRLPADHPLLRLQRAGGNAAVGALLRASVASRSTGESGLGPAPSGRGGGELSGADEAVVRDLGPGRPLDSGARESFEPRLGRDLSDVRVHDGPAASRAARSVSARAFAMGNSIAFDRGEYAPQTDEGRRLIAHELAHVVGGEGSRGETGSGPSGLPRAASGPGVRAAAPPTADAPVVMRSYVDEPAGGCGICLPPEEAGSLAHDEIQLLMQQAFGISSERAIFSPDPGGTHGFLDLVRVTKSASPPFETQIEIGEIKPYNPEGVKDGHSDLAYYLSQIQATQAISGVSPGQVEVSFLEDPAPSVSLPFVDPTTVCQGQALMVEGPYDGLYLYSCAPPRSTYPQDCCGGVPIPVPQEQQQQSGQKSNEETQQPSLPIGPSPQPANDNGDPVPGHGGQEVPAAASQGLDEVPSWVLWLLSAAAVAALGVCFATGECVVGAIVAGLGAAAAEVVAILTPILEAYGIVLIQKGSLASNDSPPQDGGADPVDDSNATAAA